MTDTIWALQYKYWINKELKHGHTFDQLFGETDNYKCMSYFLSTRIGQIWLKSEQGRAYTAWQET